MDNEEIMFSMEDEQDTNTDTNTNQINEEIELKNKSEKISLDIKEEDNKEMNPEIFDSNYRDPSTKGFSRKQQHIEEEQEINNKPQYEQKPEQQIEENNIENEEVQPEPILTSKEKFDKAFISYKDQQSKYKEFESEFLKSIDLINREFIDNSINRLTSEIQIAETKKKNLESDIANFLDIESSLEENTLENHSSHIYIEMINRKIKEIVTIRKNLQLERQDIIHEIEKLNYYLANTKKLTKNSDNYDLEI